MKLKLLGILFLGCLVLNTSPSDSEDEFHDALPPARKLQVAGGGLGAFSRIDLLALQERQRERLELARAQQEARAARAATEEARLAHATYEGRVEDLVAEQVDAQRRTELEAAERERLAATVAAREQAREQEARAKAEEIALQAQGELARIRRGVSPEQQLFRHIINPDIHALPLVTITKEAILLNEFKIPEKETMSLYVKHINGDTLVQDQGKIMLISVHGTYAHARSFGLDNNRLNSQQIINFAKVLSIAHNKPVDLLIFEWSGKLLQEDRIKAGDVLAGWIQPKLAHENYSEIWTVAHSHGCNVVNNMANTLKTLVPARPINVGVQIASPKLDQPLFDPDAPRTVSDLTKTYNFKKLYHFYSTGDNIQAAGSMEQNRYFGLFSPTYSADRKIQAPLLYHENRILYNIRIQDGDIEPDHILIKIPVMANLPKLLSIIDYQYPEYFDLDAALFYNPLIAKYPEQLRWFVTSIGKYTQANDDQPLVAIRNRESFHQGSLLPDKIITSLNFSDEQKERFKKVYQRDISKKRAHRLAPFFTNEFYSSKLVNL
ncbi:hypothetical protein HOM50_04320 [bacterium]|nr:hypothetical protein [bacterium]MBT5015604.1 hypothetical protein [bacterium]